MSFLKIFGKREKTTSSIPKKIGLIAGGTKYPLLLAKAARARKVKLIAIALEGETDPELADFVDKIYWIKIGQVKKLIWIFLKERLRNVILAGKVTKVKLFKGKLELDDEGQRLLNEIPDRSDKTLLSKLISRIEALGIKVCDSTMFLEDLLPVKGVITKRGPTQAELEDIEFGRNIASQMAGLEVGQTVVVKDKVILAIEAVEGTDRAIKRGGELGNGSIAVIKMARPKQDMRYDVPTVGIDTIRSLIEAGGGVLAFEQKKTLLLDSDECIKLADENNICITVI